MESKSSTRHLETSVLLGLKVSEETVNLSNDTFELRLEGEYPSGEVGGLSSLRSWFVAKSERLKSPTPPLAR